MAEAQPLNITAHAVVYLLNTDSQDCGCGTPMVTDGVYATPEAAQAAANRLDRAEYDRRYNEYWKRHQEHRLDAKKPVWNFPNYTEPSWIEFNEGTWSSGWKWEVVRHEVQR